MGKLFADRDLNKSRLGRRGLLPESLLLLLCL
jgi:hypothetical protein